MITLEKRNNKVYLVMTDYQVDEPKITSSFFPVNLDPDLLPDDIYRGNILQLGSAYIINTGYRELSFNITSENNYAEFNESYPVKPPRKTGYKWTYNGWIKK